MTTCNVVDSNSTEIMLDEEIRDLFDSMMDSDPLLLPLEPVSECLSEATVAALTDAECEMWLAEWRSEELMHAEAFLDNTRKAFNCNRLLAPPARTVMFELDMSSNLRELQLHLSHVIDIVVTIQGHLFKLISAFMDPSDSTFVHWFCDAVDYAQALALCCKLHPSCIVLEDVHEMVFWRTFAFEAYLLYVVHMDGVMRQYTPDMAKHQQRACFMRFYHATGALMQHPDHNRHKKAQLIKHVELLLETLQAVEIY